MMPKARCWDTRTNTGTVGRSFIAFATIWLTPLGRKRPRRISPIGVSHTTLTV